MNTQQGRDRDLAAGCSDLVQPACTGAARRAGQCRHGVNFVLRAPCEPDPAAALARAEQAGAGEAQSPTWRAACFPVALVCSKPPRCHAEPRGHCKGASAAGEGTSRPRLLALRAALQLGAGCRAAPAEPHTPLVPGHSNSLLLRVACSVQPAGRKTGQTADLETACRRAAGIQASVHRVQPPAAVQSRPPPRRRSTAAAWPQSGGTRQETGRRAWAPPRSRAVGGAQASS